MVNVRPPSPAPSTESHDSFRSAQSDILIEDVSKFTEEEIKALLAEAETVKGEGNELFRLQKWEEAKDRYSAALRCVPIRGNFPVVAGRVSRAGDTVPDGEDEDVDEGQGRETASEPRDKGKGKEVDESELEREARLARSVLHGNIGACWVKLGDHKESIKSCDESLKDDPNYVKALHRRATSSQVVGTWSALLQAEKDLKNLLQVLPPSSPLVPTVKSTLVKIRPQVAEAEQREKDEMLGKLKDLGNSILGKFGLSTDNFQFTPNGQGGYSMNFNQ